MTPKERATQLLGGETEVVGSTVLLRDKIAEAIRAAVAETQEMCARHLEDEARRYRLVAMVCEEPLPDIAGQLEDCAAAIRG